MKQLIALGIVFFMGLAPVQAETLTSIVDSEEVIKLDTIVTPQGLTKQSRTKVTKYTYMTQEGALTSLEYKVKGVSDDRELSKKHPLVYKFGPMVLGLILGKIFN